MKIAVRCDASPQIGAGHLMRCTALADAMRERGASVRFVTRPLAPHLRDLLRQRDHELVEIEGASDAAESLAALGSETWDWLVVDHYGLDATWESQLRGRAARVLVIDDLANRTHDCDVLVDQNSALESRYSERVPAGCERLLGPRFALLRGEFARVRSAVSPRSGSVKRVLVAFGGFDTDNHTQLAIDALAAAALDVAVDVVIPASHPQRASIETACAQRGFACHVQTTRMAELMAAADLAVGAVGSTTWERCCLGLPCVAVSIAANQRAMAEEFARQGLLYLAGAGDLTAASLAVHLQAVVHNAPLREMLSRNGMQAVDGRGTERVARVLDRASIRLRAATLEDADALFEWRNDERVRSGARRTDPIARPDHEAWLRSVLSDENRILLIGEKRGVPVGVVRVDISAPQAEMSVYRVPQSQESGLASSLMLAAEAWLRAQRPDVECLTGCVMGPNDRSHHLVRSNGWVLHSANYTKQLRTS